MQQERLTLLKITQHPEVGHLYEHIYLTQARRYCTANDLRASLDYQIEAGTYGSGIVYLTFYFFTALALVHKDELLNLRYDIDDDMLEMHLRQLRLENGREMEIKVPAVREELERLGTVSWIQLDSLDSINRQQIRPVSNILRESDLSYRRSRLYVNIAVDGTDLFIDRPELLGLFHQLSLLLLHNIIVVISSRTGVYSVRDSFFDYGDAAALENTFYINTKYDQFETCSAIIQEVINEVMSPAILERFADQLRTNSYWRGDFSTPSDTRIYQETGLLIGGEGWRQLATIENITKLRARMSVEMKLGRRYIEFARPPL